MGWFDPAPYRGRACPDEAKVYWELTPASIKDVNKNKRAA